MKHIYRGSYSIFFVALCVVLFCTTAFPTYAASLSLPVTPISQHLLMADSNGDTGYYDCAIAAEAMALQVLANEGKIPYPSESVSYAAVRVAVRSYYANIGKGITLRETAGTIPSLTDNTLDAAFVKIDARHWDRVLDRQLRAGYPVIVHISDWSYLDGHGGQGKAAHAIVVTGINDQGVYYVDPWDGRVHGMTYGSFAQAWAQGNYNWSGLVFIEKKPPTNFTDIMRRLTAKHSV